MTLSEDFAPVLDGVRVLDRTCGIAGPTAPGSWLTLVHNDEMQIDALERDELRRLGIIGESLAGP
jgi:hypothetical protein